MLEKFHSVAASVNVMSERNMKVVEQFSSVSKQTDFQKQTIIELTKSHKDITGTVGRYKNEVQMLEHKFKVVTQVMDDFKVQIKKDAAKAIATANASMALAEVLVHRFEQHVKESDETTERIATSLAEIEDEQLQQSEEIKRQNEEIQNLKQQQKKKQSFAKLGPHSFKYESSGLAVIDVGTHVELKSNKSIKLPPMPIAIITDGLEYNMTVSVVDHSLPEGCIVSLRSTAEEDKTLIIKGGQTTVVQLMVSFSSPLVIIPRVATPAFKLILEDVLTEHFHDASPRSRSNLQDPIELDVFIKGSYWHIELPPNLALTDAEAQTETLINQLARREAGDEIKDSLQQHLMLARAGSSSGVAPKWTAYDDAGNAPKAKATKGKKIFSFGAVPKTPRPVDANVLPNAPSTPVRGTSTPSRTPSLRKPGLFSSRAPKSTPASGSD